MREGTGDVSRTGTICSSIRGSRVTVYCRLIRVSFAGLGRDRTMLANWLANLQLGCCCICDLPIGIYESINVKRGERKRAGEEERREGTTLCVDWQRDQCATRQMHHLFMSDASCHPALPRPALPRLCSAYACAKMRLISRHTQRRVPLHPLRFLFLPRFPLIPLPSPAMVFAFINCLTCPLI